MKRTVFFVSESTGLTAETLGEALLSQFDGVAFERIYLPYIDTSDKALDLADRLGDLTREEGIRPLVFSTISRAGIREILKQSSCFYVELFDTFLGPLARELGVAPSTRAGFTPGVPHSECDIQRINAIQYAMRTDHGMRLDDYDSADLVLVGVSRSGKTPVSLYLAASHGLRAANYPLEEADFDHGGLPPVLLPCRDRLFGLHIDPERLHWLREQRRPGSGYASLDRCRREVAQAEALFRRLHIPVVDTTDRSVEETAAEIVAAL